MNEKQNTTLPAMHSRSSNGTPLYELACPECGAKRILDKRKLGKRCAPCAAEARKTHGMSSNPLYGVYKGIIIRCTYPSATNYAYYGGRGIDVCKEWRESPLSFFDWAKANGWKKGLEVDRVDSNGDYCPENCRLVSHRKNSQTTRRIKTKPEQAILARKLMQSGATIQEAAKQSGVTYMVAWHLKNSPEVWKEQC